MKKCLHGKNKDYTFAIAFEKAGIIEWCDAWKESKKFDKKASKSCVRILEQLSLHSLCE
jgi:hypothetical protein